MNSQQLIDPRTTRDTIGWFAFFVICSVLLAQQLWYGKTFPIPWNDETAFISQAFELAHHGRLFVWGLNPDDTVMWMPPGYMVLLGLLYKLVGYDYTLTRMTSMLCYLVTYVLLWRTARAHLSGWTYRLCIIATLLFHLSLKSLLSANIARMDALMVLCIVLGTLQFIKHRYALGLSIILASALIHYNAIYAMILPAAVIAHSLRWRNSLIIRPHELLALVLSILALAIYAIYVSRHFDAYLHDMKFQFDWKAGTSRFMGGEEGITLLLVLLVTPIMVLMTSSSIKPSSILFLGGIALLALALNGGNMWYNSAIATGFALYTVGLAIEWQEARWRIVSAAVVVMIVYVLFSSWNLLGLGKAEPGLMERNVLTPGRVFLSDEEIEKVKSALRAMPEGSRISFGYTGIEPLFFDTLHENKLRWTIPGHSVTKVLPAREIDFRVLCDSSLYPPVLLQFDWDGYPRKGLDTGCVVYDKRVTPAVQIK